MITPVELTCEYRINPSGIDEPRPRLSWQIAAEERGQRQTSYHILVSGNKENLAAGIGDFWDSGRISSSETVHIRYQGLPLASGKAYYWKVMVWDKNGNPSDWSALNFWSMGLLQADDWQADWIGYDAALTDDQYPVKPWGNGKKKRTVYRPLPAPYLRTEFLLSKAVRRAVVYATALGVFELSLNGDRVGNDYFAPGWTDYHKRLYYQTYDVTSLLRSGNNCLGAILADGWFAGNVANVGQQYYGSKLRLKLQLQVEYADGTSETFISDPSWKTTYGPILEADMQGGETYDARLEMPGWDHPGFDDAEWAPVDTAAEVSPLLQAYPAEPVNKLGEMQPAQIFEREPGVYIVDMGQNFAGWARLKISGTAGTKVTLQFAEMLNADSTLHLRNLRTARATDTYFSKGGGEEIFEPRFTYHGYRYIEVRGYPGEMTADKISGIVVHSNLNRSGFFDCSNELLNTFYRNILWSQKGNFLEIPTDCPQRDERMGWLGDVQVFMPIGMYNLDIDAFIAKWMRDVVDSQFEDGRIPSTAPVVYKRVAAAWADAVTIVPWQLYQFYEDVAVLEKTYPAMKRWVDYLQETSENHLSTMGSFGDWQNAGSETQIDVLATAYFAHSCSLLAEIAKILHRPEDAQKYQALFDDVRAAFETAYIDETGKIKGDTQGAYVMALQFNLLTESRRKMAETHLLRRINERDNKLSTGLICSGGLLQSLTEAGEVETAYKLISSTEYPSWGYQITQGATTPWERWNGFSAEKGFYDDVTNSFNHYTFGAAGEWLYSSLAGITPLAPGFRKIQIRPQPVGDITYAKAIYHSIRGEIASDWTLENDVFNLDVKIPPNTTARIYVPTSDKDLITENGTPVQAVDGITYVGMENGMAIFEAASGSYKFTSPFRN